MRGENFKLLFLDHWHAFSFNYCWSDHVSIITLQCEIFYCGSCSASCAYPTMGDLRALATAAHEGLGFPLFNQYSSMAVRQSSGSWLLFFLIALSLPTEMPSLRPILNHFTLASHTASRTSPRLSAVSSPVKN